VDGVYKGQSMISGPTTVYRMQFAAQELSSATHTLRLVVKGTSRFDVDAFAILK
jgi:hypothetical protein